MHHMYAQARSTLCSCSQVLLTEDTAEEFSTRPAIGGPWANKQCMSAREHLEFTYPRAHAIEEGSRCQVGDIVGDLKGAKGCHASCMHDSLGRHLPVKLQHSASRSMSVLYGLTGTDRESSCQASHESSCAPKQLSCAHLLQLL